MGVPSYPRKVNSCDPDIPAVTRALDLLEFLVYSDRGLTLAEVGRQLRIAKSSSHRLIHTLLGRGYLQRELDGHHYVLGMRTRDFAAVTTAEHQLRVVCFRHAQQLAKRLQLTALVAVLKGGEAVVILKVDSPSDTYPGAWVGHHMDLHCTALGKVLIAHLPEREIERILQTQSLAQYTPSTICRLGDLLTDLTAIRTRGFALNNEEYTPGGRGLAAPIFNHIGSVIASICVRGSTSQFPKWRIPKCGREVVSAASEISRDLLEAMPREVQPSMDSGDSQEY